MSVKAPLQQGNCNDPSRWIWCRVDCVKDPDPLGMNGYFVYLDGLLIGTVDCDRVETQYSSGNVKWCTHTTEATRWSALPALTPRDAQGRMYSSRMDHGSRREALAELLDAANNRELIHVIVSKDGGKSVGLTDSGQERRANKRLNSVDAY